MQAKTGDRTGTMPGQEAGPLPESGRARVRRLLFDPMAFRSPARLKPEDETRTLNALADELAYMTDESLAALRGMLQSKGQGRLRNLWPDLPTVRALAEAVQHRPLVEMPALVRWFRSVEGPRAILCGTLLATWEYFEARKVPPYTPAARARVTARAGEIAHRLKIIEDRRSRGVGNSADDLQFEQWCLTQTSALTDLVGNLKDNLEGAS